MRPLISAGNVYRSICQVYETDTLAAIDPTSLTAIVLLPDDTQETFVYEIDSEIVRISEGDFHLYYDTTGKIPGIYRVQWLATGDVDFTKQSKFEIPENLF